MLMLALFTPSSIPAVMPIYRLEFNLYMSPCNHGVVVLGLIMPPASIGMSLAREEISILMSRILELSGAKIST